MGEREKRRIGKEGIGRINSVKLCDPDVYGECVLRVKMESS